MKVRELMTKTAVSYGPETSLAAAGALCSRLLEQMGCAGNNLEFGLAFQLMPSRRDSFGGPLYPCLRRSIAMGRGPRMRPGPPNRVAHHAIPPRIRGGSGPWRPTGTPRRRAETNSGQTRRKRVFHRNLTLISRLQLSSSIALFHSDPQLLRDVDP